ncbi:MAG: S49 family peptidase [Pseudomonadota bacterium]
MKHPLLAARLYNTPHMMLPEKAQIIDRVFQGNAALVDLETTTERGLSLVDNAEERQKGLIPFEPAYDSGLIYSTQRGIARIAVHDTLTARNGLHPSSGMTGYNGLQAKLRTAMTDDKVRGIYLEIDSPGGEGTGALDLSTEIASVNETAGGKPIMASIGTMGASAAYAIASGADLVTASPTAEVGSIGVLAMLLDAREALEMEGLKVTILRSGDKKAKPNPYEDQDDEDVARVQASMDKMYDVFAGLMAAHRGLEKQAIIDQQAAIFDADEALDRGLIDGIATPGEAFEMFAAYVGQANS